MLRKQALFYALKKNSWQSVQLLLNAGVALPNRDSSLKGLFPREKDESSNDETAVPNSLNSCLLSERVKELTIEHVLRNYRVGILSDEMRPGSGQASPSCFPSTGIDDTLNECNLSITGKISFLISFVNYVAKPL